MDSREACEFHCSHVQVDNPVNVIGGCPSATRTVTPQNVHSHTKPTTLPEAYDETFHSTKGSRATIHTPFGIGVNRGQQFSIFM